MLDDLKKLFSRTIDSFFSELGKRDPEDHVAELLSAMRREMVDARAQLPLLEQNHKAAVLELERERKRLDDTVRRGGMAEKIGDAETVRVAKEFEDKHRRRVAVLEEKVRATRAEWDLRVEESREMMTQFKQAETHRFALLAELRRQGARGRIDSMMGGAPRPPSDDFSRAEERVGADADYADALDGLDADLGRRPPPPPPDDVDARLAELKRRMGM